MLDLQVLGGLRGEQGDVGQLLHLDLVLQVLDVVACDMRIENPTENRCLLFIPAAGLDGQLLFQLTDSVGRPPIGQL